ncbi:MAG TPA: GNAT family N-acetyltransferase [Trebonia sp.]|nr:GNAT family N-acetyltransferase [Trebonia sp.]
MDDSYLVDAFTQALSPYYEGNHLVHAQRVLKTHLSGGKDNRGLLSTRQLLLVLWSGGERRGILNLVFKRQATCKISPLILFPSIHNSLGLGAILIRAAEEEARRAGARNLYCTVARNNRRALDFFLEHGFVECGEAPEQYKTGVTETLLRRTLIPSIPLGTEDMISVARVGDDAAWKAVRKLLSRSLPQQIDGVNSSWLESMHRNALDDGATQLEEGRSAWVYAAQDRSGRYRAAAIVTYKKGGALKIMPIASSDIGAFRALIVDLPTLLHGCGRKAYLHLAPTAAEVVALQESAWNFEALLPGAYREEVVTQQWGCSLGPDAPPQRIRIQPRYLSMVKRGDKKLEIRVGYEHIKRIRSGDSVVLVAGPEQLVRQVREVRRYSSLRQMLEHEDIEQVLPGSSPDGALRRLQEIYPPEKEKLGIVVLDLC